MTALAAAVVLLAACGADGPTAPAQDGPAQVSFALDWTPNTNHTGLYVAIDQGYFAEAGIDVTVLPYSGTSPDQLLDAGAADVGISFHSASVMAQAAGADVVTVLAPLQHWASAIAVRADLDITRPRDLDGRTYAGYGGPTELPMIEAVIRADGGRGEFRSVTLGTSAYEALYAGDADFVLPFVAWEGLEAARRGVELRYFRYTDFGFPDAYAVVVNASRRWAEDDPGLATAFVTALRRGYEFARDEPRAAAEILLAAEPDAFGDPGLVTASQELLAAEYMTAADGSVGTIDLDRWSAYADVLLDAGLVVDGDGAVLTTRPDWRRYVTDAYLG